MLGLEDVGIPPGCIHETDPDEVSDFLEFAIANLPFEIAIAQHYVDLRAVRYGIVQLDADPSGGNILQHGLRNDSLVGHADQVRT